jgi:hypothetical protein
MLRKLALVLIALGMLPVTAYAQGRIAAYFDSRGSKRTINSPGVGEFSLVFIYGEAFEAEFVSGLQYIVDYGPQLTFVADLGLPPVAIGNSATGLSLGFGAPRAGVKFMVHAALVQWTSDCSMMQNADVRTGPHPDFPDATPIATSYPDFAIVEVEARRSQTCPMLELDVNPLVCPNSLATTAWQSPGAPSSAKDRWVAIALLGSPTVDLADINLASIRLEGVSPQGLVFRTLDISYADGDNACACDFPLPDGAEARGLLELRGGMGPEHVGRFIDPGADGQNDLMLFFDKRAIAHAISPVPPPAGTEVQLVLRGAYSDGMPFESRDCIVIGASPAQPDGSAPVGGETGGESVAGMGYPNPNPFNPVTRVPYTVPATQRVRVAVYDVAGRLVVELVNEVKEPGDYVAEWNAANLASGIYFYRLDAGGRSTVRRATLLK